MDYLCGFFSSWTDEICCLKCFFHEAFVWFLSLMNWFSVLFWMSLMLFFPPWIQVLFHASFMRGIIKNWLFACFFLMNRFNEVFMSTFGPLGYHRLNKFAFLFMNWINVFFQVSIQRRDIITNWAFVWFLSFMNWFSMLF